MKKTYEYFIQHFEGKGYDALTNYLSDSAYIGKYKLYRKDIYLENYIPAILDIELWNTVQNLKTKKTITKKNNIDDIFSGLVYCNCCKCRLCKKIDNRTKNRLVRYVCDNSYRYKPGTKIKKCSNSNIVREDYIETYLLENILLELEKFKIKSEIEEKTIVNNNPQKIKSIENKILKLKDLYLDDLIDKETYKKDYEKYSKKLSELRTVKTVKKSRDLSNLEKIFNSNYLNIYNKLSISNKKKFWLSAIDKIYVEKGEIKEVTFL